MFSKEFTYKDYLGKVRKETYFFNLEKDELMKKELGNYGGLEYAMKQMMKEERPDKVLDILEDIVLSAVGEISPDGRRFIKNEQIRTDFKQTKMFSDLVFSMMTDENALRNFILGAIPDEVSQAYLNANDEKEAEVPDKVVTIPAASEGMKPDASN